MNLLSSGVSVLADTHEHVAGHVHHFGMGLWLLFYIVSVIGSVVVWPCLHRAGAWRRASRA